MEKSIYTIIADKTWHHSQDRLTLCARLTENPTLNLAWLGKDLWVTSFLADEYARLLSACDNGMHEPKDECVAIMVEHHIKQYKEFIAQPHNVRDNSTSALHNEVSTWRFIAIMNLIEELQNLINL